MVTRAREYVDLVLVVGLLSIATITIGAGATGVVRVAAAIPLVTILPGYALMALVYPGGGTPPRRDFDENEHGLRVSNPGLTGITGVERLAFSVVTSPVIVAAVALVSSFTPWGVTLAPILVGVVSLSVLFVLGAAIRRTQLDDDRRPTPSIGGVFSGSIQRAGRQSRGRQRVFTLALAGGVLLFAGSLAFAALAPPQTAEYTEFYVGGQNVTGDTQSMYPSQFDASGARDLSLVVANHEGVDTDYSVVVLLQRVEGAGRNATVLEQQPLAQRTVTVSQGEKRTLTVPIKPTMTGTDLRLRVLLYRGDPPEVPSASNAYRTLRLPIDVGGSQRSALAAPTGA